MLTVLEEQQSPARKVLPIAVSVQTLQGQRQQQQLWHTLLEDFEGVVASLPYLLRIVARSWHVEVVSPLQEAS